MPRNYEDFPDLFASDSIYTNQSDDTDENEADESSDYNKNDNLPLSEPPKTKTIINENRHSCYFIEGW